MKKSNTDQVSMIGFAKDLPNICSLVGLLCTMFAIYFAIEGYFIASIIAILWSVLFDWFDGIIARRMKGRTKAQGDFGGQLDSMIDIVSFGVYPAILLLSYSGFNVWYMPGAFIIVAGCAIRLSYFNIYGLIDSKTYMGLSIDNNAILLAFGFLFESFFSHSTFSVILYILLMSLTALNLSSLPTPKLAGKWVYVLTAYVLVLTAIFAWILWSRV
ncbi:MAG: CDP-alcohol phosphatidyltransferase family protein [Crocinitomicaceae bacterium]|nr:CDP-alcohol phosphatidyltransferase family protein [Flavobacteriales bacterium]NQZ36179.1 CDP-alcohol phosphatidyltransferase family protein [Crocinitomicaceae bacterium]